MSLSIPKTCLTETFMSGRATLSCIAAVIGPPWLRNAEAPVLSDSNGPADGGRNLADALAAKNPPRLNSTINYFNKIGAVSPVRKAGLGCPAAKTRRQPNPTDFK